MQVISQLPLGPLAPVAALCVALPTLVAQCYVVSFPLTAGFCSLAVQFADIVDGAFVGMAAVLESKLHSYVHVLGLPADVEAKVFSTLAYFPS